MNKAKLVPGLILGCAVILWVALTGQPTQAADNLQWFRGQLHTHTYWSDGRAFPERAIKEYKQRGYQFLAMTDHNRFANNKGLWRKVEATEKGWPPTICQAYFDQYVETFGKEWVESKTNGLVTSVRLKTYTELKAKFEEPGKFILLPGVEITQTVHNRGVHLNYINLPSILPCIKGANLIKTVNETTISEIIALNALEAEQIAIEQQRPYIIMLNHPFWVYYDILPQNLIERPEIRFFEICNNGSSFAPNVQAQTYTVDKFWDIVNAFRLIHKHQLLYGIGSDDAHFYDPERIKGQDAVGDAWIMVHAATLTPKDLISAMRKGDFYASTGVLLEDVVFTSANKTLRVKVKAEKGVHYRIQFITTKDNFDQSVTEISSPAGKGQRPPARTIPIYSDDIGRIVKTVEGTEATYQLEADDLYIRARVESDSPSKITPHFHPKVKTAWTQPYTTSSH
ncbi:MAG: hypothetical protein WCS73_09565 [Lentisphaeria bacterium]